MFGDLFRSWRRPKRRKARLPEGRRIYAVGDIHGRLDLLDTLHGLITEDAAKAPGQSKTIVYLGDYIDRGVESRGIIDRLLGAPLKDVEPIFLLGNHEETLLNFIEDHGFGESWLQFGGDATLYSYGVSLTGPLSDQRTMIKAQLDLREKMPETHLAFLRGLKTHYRIGDYFFAHAGIRPGIPVDQQTTEDLIWIRDEFLKSTVDHGLVVVHGHSISLQVEDLPNRINIDTGAYATNVLTCLVLEDENHWLLQTGGVETFHTSATRA